MSATVTPLQARDALAASVARRDRLIVLTGDAGSGISALCRAVVDADGITTSWVDARETLTFYDILRQAAADLQAGANPPATADDLAEAASEQELIALLVQAIDTNATRAAAIVVDDAHALPRFVVGKLQTLVDLAIGERRLVVLLAGQPALEQTLDRPECLAVRQQIVTRLRIGTPAAPEAGVPAPKTVRAAWTPAAIRPRRMMTIVAALAFAGVGLWVALNIARRSPPARPPVVTSSPVPSRVEGPAPQSQPPAPSAVEGPAPSAVEGPAPSVVAGSATPPSPTASAPPPAATVSTPPAAPPVNTPPAGVPPALAEAGRPSTPELDAKLEQLHQRMEGEAIDLARRKDVNGLIALRAKTEAAYAQIGARRPDFLAALLAELDAYLTQARSVRRP